jgi:hypothetical protein
MVDRRVEREGWNEPRADAEVIGRNRGRWLCSKLMEIPLFCIHQLFSYYFVSLPYRFPPSDNFSHNSRLFIGFSLGIPLNLLQLERQGLYDLRPSWCDGSMLLGLDRTLMLFPCSRCRVLVCGMMHD